MQGEDPLPYLEAMALMTSPGGLIPEQVWDVDLPEHGITRGTPTGSAMPLVWAHAEFVKLAVARTQGHPIEMLQAVWQRYHGIPPAATTWYWRLEAPIPVLPVGRALVIEHRRPFLLHWGVDGWQKIENQPSAPLSLGMYGVRLDWAVLQGRHMLNFTWHCPEEGGWQGQDYVVRIAV
jgi:glucoamylase